MEQLSQVDIKIFIFASTLILSGALMWVLLVLAKTHYKLRRVLGETSLQKLLDLNARLENLEMRHTDVVDRITKWQQRESIQKNRANKQTEKELLAEAKRIVESDPKPDIIPQSDEDMKNSLRKRVLGNSNGQLA